MPSIFFLFTILENQNGEKEEDVLTKLVTEPPADKVVTSDRPILAFWCIGVHNSSVMQGKVTKWICFPVHKFTLLWLRIYFPQGKIHLFPGNVKWEFLSPVSGLWHLLGSNAIQISRLECLISQNWLALPVRRVRGDTIINALFYFYLPSELCISSVSGFLGFLVVSSRLDWGFGKISLLSVDTPPIWAYQRQNKTDSILWYYMYMEYGRFPSVYYFWYLYWKWIIYI